MAGTEVKTGGGSLYTDVRRVWRRSTDLAGERRFGRGNRAAEGQLGEALHRGIELSRGLLLDFVGGEEEVVVLVIVTRTDGGSSGGVVVVSREKIVIGVGASNRTT